MDESRFDRFVTAVGTLRSRRAMLALPGALAAWSLPDPEPGAARHRKKKRCAKQCEDGCCTSKYGKCLPEGIQSTSRCGAGGEICRRTGCPECTATRPCPLGQCCSGSGACGACLTFVTSTSYTGKLQGWIGARTICDTLAASAGLPGHYQPWLSDGNITPAGTVPLAAGPSTRFTLVDGTLVANSRAELASGALRHAINLTESGAAGTSNPG